VIRLKLIETVGKVQANTSGGVASGQSVAAIAATANARHAEESHNKCND
jgi:uncharacterized protein YoaH (UPF0181 family)